jgi:hypothetical protein
MPTIESVLADPTFCPLACRGGTLSHALNHDLLVSGGSCLSPPLESFLWVITLAFTTWPISPDAQDPEPACAKAGSTKPAQLNIVNGLGQVLLCRMSQTMRRCKT